MYVTLLPVPVGPVVLEQETPETPAIDHVLVPVGVTPPVGPETVAVNTNVLPRVAAEALVVTTTVGETLDTFKL